MPDLSHRPKKGDRYRVRQTFVAIVLTQWFAPFTGGEKQPIPAGLEFVVEWDPPSTATGLSVKPDPYKRWESELVSESDRNDERYGGYAISITFDLLNAHCELV